jgi:hypothetical protein
MSDACIWCMATLGLEPPLDCRNGGVSCPSHPQFSRQNYCCICIIICKHMSIIYIHIQYNIYVTCYEKQCILLHYKMLSLYIYIYSDPTSETKPGLAGQPLGPRLPCSSHGQLCRCWWFAFGSGGDARWNISAVRWFMIVQYCTNCRGWVYDVLLFF